MSIPKTFARKVLPAAVHDWVKTQVRSLAGPGEIARYHHRADRMATMHNTRFEGTPGFPQAYARGVKAGEWDFGIPYRIHQALWCAAQARKVAGDFVELGTGRGFVMSAVLEAFPNWAGSGRSMYLFDTFESQWVDASGKRAATSRFYAKSFDEVRNNFAEWPRVHLIKGDVFETIPVQNIDCVAMLHIDLNYYKPEVYGLRYYWDRIPTGGVVLLDDYAHPNREAQYDAMNEVANAFGVSILSTASGQGIIVK